MNYLPVEEGLQAVFEQSLPLSRAQVARVCALSIALLLAADVHLTRIARFLKRQGDQDSRVKWLRRLFAADYLSQEHLYQPLLKVALTGMRDRCWHLVIDRTTLWDREVDLATIVLNYHKRAIPLVWCFVPFGGAPASTYTALIERCVPLVPAHIQVVFHGDTEFGGATILRMLRQHEWDFILAQKRNVCFRRQINGTPQAMRDLPVTRHHSCSMVNVELFSREWLAGINLFAFYQPHNTQTGRRKRDICYLTTSLPLNPDFRRLGRRRWGTEPFYRDFKSAGWQVTDSELQSPCRREGLLTMLAVVYLWTVVVGRRLCKTGQRRRVDSQRRRHLSLCRLGWDWLIHQLRCNATCPTDFTLYS